MKKHQLYFVILAVMAAAVFSGCEGLAELIHGPKPEEEPVYTVSFNINGGNGTAPAAMTASAGSTITLPSGSVLSRSGYTFGGWNTSSAGTGTNYSAFAVYTVTANITLYARWVAVANYTVTFNANGGSGTVPAAQSQSSGASITLPSGSGLSRSGYTFGGWNTNATGTGNNYSGGSAYTVSGNVILYARWIAVGTTTYTVTFNVNSGSGTAPAAMTASSGASITLPGGSGLTRSGYTFGGWNTDTSGAGTNYNAGSSYTVTGNVTLYARWIVVGTTTYTVTYNINGGSGTAPSTQTASSGSTITLSSGSGLTRTGYTFGGWNTSAAGTGINYPAGFSYTVSGNITLYAKWDAIAAQQYTVTFDANGATSGTAPAAQTASYGSGITLPSSSGLSRTGYTFGGWNTNTSGTGTNYSGGSSYTVSGNVTLYAEWEPVTDVPGATLAAKLSWLQTNAVSNIDYTVEVTANESISPATLSYSGRTNIGITLRGTGAVRTVSLSSVGAMFTVPSGVTLVLDNNITLQGRSDNNNSLVVVNAGGTLVMNAGSAVTGNTITTAGSGGGGVEVADGTFTMNGGEISGNAVPNDFGGGVGVWVNGTFTMSGGKISDNTAGGGGGVYTDGTFTMSDGEISGNTTSGNTASGNYGGGVYVSRNGTFTMEDGEISDNTTSSGGGGVYVSIGTFTMSGGEISSNTAYRGGGVHMYSGTFTLEGGEISNNTASVDGGGVYMIYDCNFTMSGMVKISDNTASSGGGVCVATGTFTMSNGEISGNTASSGGGVCVHADGTFTMEDGKISGNTSSGNGGGVYATGIFTMSNGEISGNTANNNGGGVSVYNSTNNITTSFTMEGGEISGNTAGSYGGGVCVFTSGTGNATFTMTGGVISGNTAPVSGGGVNVSAGGTFTMSGTAKISGNTGGGVYVSGSGNSYGTFTMSDGTISGNTSSNGYGGGVLVSGGGTFFTKTGGMIYGYTGDANSNNGLAVAVTIAYSVTKRREATAGPKADLSFDGTTNPPTWSGWWDREVEIPTYTTYGLQEDGAYTLDPKEFRIWYGVTKNENVVSFTTTHGGVYFNYPTTEDGFDITNYESLVITYTCTIDTVGTDDKGDAGARLTFKVLNAPLGGSYYGTDIIYYPYALSSGGTLTIDDSTLNHDKFWATDVQGDNGSLGFAIAKNGNATSDVFTITFTSITFMPGD